MDKLLKLIKIEADPEGVGLLKVEYDGEIIEVMYYVDMNDDFHFFYEAGTKPKDSKFEEKLMNIL